MARSADLHKGTEGQGTGPGRAGRWGWPWLVAAAFVLGVVVGVLLVGLLRLGNPDFPTASAPSTTPPGSESSAPAPSTPRDQSVEVQVNAACLRVIQDAQELYDIIADVPGAAAGVDLRRLDEIVRKLSPIQPRLRSDLSQCNVDTSISGSPTSSTTPAPSPTR